MWGPRGTRNFGVFESVHSRTTGVALPFFLSVILNFSNFFLGTTTTGTRSIGIFCGPIGFNLIDNILEICVHPFKLGL